MFKGKEKEGKVVCPVPPRNKFLSPVQKRTWLTHYHMCLQIARAVRRLHAAGLAHSDLSYKKTYLLTRKVVKQPSLTAIILSFPVISTGCCRNTGLYAPEVLQTRALKVGDPNKKLPSIQTDRHALAVLIYMYLLNRHPLRGGKVNDLDAAKDEELPPWAKSALFVEHPTDKSNRPKVQNLAPSELPQGDVTKRPYTHLWPISDRVVQSGFHRWTS